MKIRSRSRSRRKRPSLLLNQSLGDRARERHSSFRWRNPSLCAVQPWRWYSCCALQFVVADTHGFLGELILYCCTYFLAKPCLFNGWDAFCPGNRRSSNIIRHKIVLRELNWKCHTLGRVRPLPRDFRPFARPYFRHGENGSRLRPLEISRNIYDVPGKHYSTGETPWISGPEYTPSNKHQ